MIYVFGEYELDLHFFELRCAGTTLQLEPKSFDLLTYLIKHRNRVVGKDELHEHLWPQQFISESTFDHCIMEARRAIGDSGKVQRLLKTVRGRGYRFVAAVAERTSAERELPALTPALTPGQQPALAAGERYRCPQCQYHNTRGARFCTECGTSLQGTCPQCQQTNAADSKFCGACGYALSLYTAQPSEERAESLPAYTPRHLVEQVMTTRSALEGERKQVTVVFCDLVGSVDLSAHLGPERMHEVLNRFFKLALQVIHRYEGTINQFLSDGFMALFGAPMAHEDHARRAVFAALELQEEVLQQQEMLLPWQAEGDGTALQPIRIRLGVHTGLVVVGSLGDNLRMDYTAVGDTTNLAARLQQHARPGTVLISEATAKLVEDEVRLETLEPVYVRGKIESVCVYQAVHRGPRRSPLVIRLGHVQSPFVGRDRELQALHQLLAQARRGQGQVVGLVAEPGMGKSRLVYEFLHSLAGQEVPYLVGHCVSYGKTTPYLPVLDMFRHACSIAENETADGITGKVQRYLQALGLATDHKIGQLVQFLGGKADVPEGREPYPELRQQDLFASLVQVYLKSSQHGPLILVVEDLHWMDQSSEEFFASLVENLPGTSLLFLTTARPGYRPPWSGASYATQMALQRLLPAEGLTIAYAVSQQESLTHHVAQTILAKADGNPLFLEELTRVMVDREGSYADAPMPDTIQGVLMARLDRLDDTCKRLLQTAAVLGSSFARRLLEAIWEEPGPVDPYLRKLKQLEFVYEEAYAEETRYRFKHALTQEVAYGSMLTSRRQRLHRLTAQALEHLYSERLVDAYDRLAYHYAQAEDAANAVLYLRLFAEKSVQEHAHGEALLALQKALLYSERLPHTTARQQQRLYLSLQVATCMVALGRYEDALAYLHQQQPHLLQSGDGQLAGRYVLLQSQTASYLSDWPQAASCAEQAVAVALRSGDDMTLGQAYHVLAMQRYWTDQPLQGITYSQQAITALERTAEKERLGMAHFVLALNALLFGDFDCARAAVARVRALGETRQDRRLLTFASWTTGWLQATRGEYEAAIAACHHALEISSDPLNTALATGWLGYACLEKGDVDVAILHLEQAIRSLRPFGYRRLEGLYNVLLGEAHLRQHHLQRACEFVAQGFSLVSAIPYRTGMAWAQRTRGRIARVAGDYEQAAQELTAACSLWRTIPARFEVGRTHLDLAILAQEQGDREAITCHLTEAYHVFRDLDVPVYGARVTQQARACGLTMTSV